MPLVENILGCGCVNGNLKDFIHEFFYYFIFQMNALMYHMA